MKKIFSTLARADEYLGKAEAGAIIAFGVIMTAVVFLQVLYRYLLSSPLYWSEELARYLFVWLSLMGAALALKKRGHFGLDLFYRMLPDPGKRITGPLIHILVAVPVLVILIWGIALVEKTASQESPAMGISMGWAYAGLPVAGALMAFHLLVIFLKDSLPQRAPRTLRSSGIEIHKQEPG